MKNYAFMFPGQGSQSVGMGKDLYDNSTAAKEVFQEVDDALNQKLSELMFSGDSDILTLTTNAQPALMAVSLAVIKTLEAGGLNLSEVGLCFAGHSLGEYSAYAAAGCFSLSDTARLLRIRGNAMQSACPENLGAMVAILGGDDKQAKQFAEEASKATGDICCLANDNAPGQAVLSGHKTAIDKAIEIATAAGIKRCMLLPVSAPFHCPLMQPAADAMQQALDEVKIQAPSLPIIANVTVAPVTEPEDIKKLLVEQVTATVRWSETPKAFRQLGVEQAIECGVGKVLSGLMKRIDSDMACSALHTMEDIESFMNSL